MLLGRHEGGIHAVRVGWRVTYHGSRQRVGGAGTSQGRARRRHPPAINLSRAATGPDPGRDDRGAAVRHRGRARAWCHQRNVTSPVCYQRRSFLVPAFPTSIAAARSQMTAISPLGTFSQAELADERVITRCITRPVPGAGPAVLAAKLHSRCSGRMRRNQETLCCSRWSAV